MAKRYNKEAAEWEANEIAFQFQNSHDVVGDMSRAYHTDFSGIRLHEDEAAQARVSAAGTDALATGSDIYFKKGILSSHDPASRGLVAHELAHTMQQGIVAGDVAESAPAGAEQGGILDTIKGWFGGKKKPKYQHLGGEIATDDASLAYMRAMREREAELQAQKEAVDQQMWPQKRADVMASLGPVQNQAISPELLQGDAELVPDAVKNSNENWNASAGKAMDSRIAQAFMGFGHRGTGAGIGKLDFQMRNQVFAGSQGEYGDYLHALDANGANFQMMAQGMKTMQLGMKDFQFNDYSIDMTKDLFGITSRYLLSESGLDYLGNMTNGIKDAEVFDPKNNTRQTPLDYAMVTLMTGEGIRAATGMKLRDDYSQTGEDAKAREKFARAGREAMMLPMLISRMSDEQRAQLPANLQSLFAEYENIKRRINDALAARKAGA